MKLFPLRLFFYRIRLAGLTEAELAVEAREVERIRVSVRANGSLSIQQRKKLLDHEYDRTQAITEAWNLLIKQQEKQS